MRKYNNKWYATITFNSKKKYLGTFDTKVEAAMRYNEEALKLFGEFANLNII